MRPDMLEKIKSPKDIKGFTYNQITELCGEIREKILSAVKNNGGHLASNMGMVETTVALHRVFDCPEDALIFDVGHQCYTHKLLTGRAEEFESIRTFGGLSGFTNREESSYDLLTAGHSGSALPTALGIARANSLKGNGRFAVAVIGDGSFTNGMVYETLNSCAGEDLPLIIVLNDNEMSISRNVGSISGYFSVLRNSRKYFALKHRLLCTCRRVPVVGRWVEKVAYVLKEFFKNLFLSKNLFENMGLYYMGPVDGHDEAKLEAVFREAKTKDKCTLVHVLTVKGKGDPAAEKHPDSYHFTGGKGGGGESFSSVFGDELLSLAKNDERIVAVTAAMDKGTGLDRFKNELPRRFFDVGIAEECAVTFTGGLAIGGSIPVAALYSTFLQRGYDQVLEDLALQKTHSVLAIDRAGLVGGDGVTHQGVYDVALLSTVPDITLWAPETFEETRRCLRECVCGEGLCALRYPKGSEKDYDRSTFREGECLSVSGEGETVIVTYGRLCANAVEAVQGMRGVKILKLLRLLPLPEKEILEETENVKRVFVLEEGVRRGGIGEAISSLLSPLGIPVSIRAVEGFLPHGTVKDLEKICGFLPEDIRKELNSLISEECLQSLS